MFTRFAQPARFFALADRIAPWLWGLVVLGLAVGLPWSLLFVQPDYQQGDTVRIMYVHVPAAWMAMFVYASMAVASFVALVWRHPLAEIAAVASAPIGAAFTFCALVTGSLWGKPMWGTYWEWDGRMTSVLILFFIYLAHIALSHAFEDPAQGRRIANIFALVGVLILPIIKFSVEWWNTLHQSASVFRMDGPTIETSMLWPLLIMGLTFQVLYFALLIVRMHSEMAAVRLRSSRLALMRREQTAEAASS
jgi:heme exporter protein C